MTNKRIVMPQVITTSVEFNLVRGQPNATVALVEKIGKSLAE